MAVFQQTSGLTTIQFKQLDALESLQDSLEDIFKLQDKLYRRIDTFPDTILFAANLIKSAILHPELNEEQSEFYDDIASSLKATNRQLEQTADELIETLEKNHEENVRNQQMLPGMFDGLKDTLIDFAKSQSSLMIDSANEWTRMYNDTIKYIGTDRAESQQFRKDILSITDDLNADIGSLGDFGAKMDPQKVMDTMLSIAHSTDISDVDTLKALTKPILLAQETTNLNTAELAKISNRFYNRYDFTSAALENMVDNVRNLTEGQNINEDSLVAFADKVAAYYYHNGYQGEDLEKAINSAMKESAMLQANNIDVTEFEKFFELALSNTVEADTTLSLVLGQYKDQFVKAVRSGDGAGMEWLKILSSYADNPNMLNAGRIGELGGEIDLYAAEKALSDLEKGEGVSYEDLMKENATATERLEDKFVSIGDQVKNDMHNITGILSTIQETTGVGMSDIALLLATMGNVKTLLGDRGIAGILGGGVSAAGGGTSILASLGKAGAIGLAVAGVAAVAGSIYETYKDVNADKIAAAGDLSKGAAEGTEFIRTSTLDSEGKVSWGYKSVDTSDFSTEELEKFHLDQTTKEKEYEDYIKSGANLKWYQKAWDIFSDVSGDGMGIVKGTQLEQQKLTEQIASYLKDERYREMMNQYVGRLDFSKNNMLSGFIKHIDEYLEYYNEGKVAEVKKNGSPGAVADMVASYDVGTNYVEKDQLARIHEGEEIVPKKYNPAANMDEIRAIVSASDNRPELESILDVLSDIKDFMDYWKSDNDKKSAIKSAKTAPAAIGLQRYYSRG